MQPPRADAFTSALTDVRENEAFSDETIIDQTRVIVYSTEVAGPSAAEFGEMVSGDFQTVLTALKHLAERS